MSSHRHIWRLLDAILDRQVKAGYKKLWLQRGFFSQVMNFFCLGVLFWDYTRFWRVWGVRTCIYFHYSASSLILQPENYKHVEAFETGQRNILEDLGGLIKKLQNLKDLRVCQSCEIWPEVPWSLGRSCDEHPRKASKMISRLANSQVQGSSSGFLQNLRSILKTILKKFDFEREFWFFFQFK